MSNISKITNYTVYKEGDGIYFQTLYETASQWPCPSGFHIPTQDEMQFVFDTLKTLEGGTVTVQNLQDHLFMPPVGYIDRQTGQQSTSYGVIRIWTCTFSWAQCYAFKDDTGGIWLGLDKPATGMQLRPFANQPIIPETGWTTVLSSGDASLSVNHTLGLMTITDGEKYITFSDKNLGATAYYDGTVTAANTGHYYQAGNNYGFDTPITNTSDTKVNPTGYGPGNYYNSDTYICGTNISDWRTRSNNNLWWGIGIQKGISINVDRSILDSGIKVVDEFPENPETGDIVILSTDAKTYKFGSGTTTAYLYNGNDNVASETPRPGAWDVAYYRPDSSSPYEVDEFVDNWSGYIYTLKNHPEAWEFEEFMFRDGTEITYIMWTDANIDTDTDTDKLVDLKDTQISSVQNEDIINYDSTKQKYVNSQFITDEIVSNAEYNTIDKKDNRVYFVTKDTGMRGLDRIMFSGRQIRPETEMPVFDDGILTLQSANSEGKVFVPASDDWWNVTIDGTLVQDGATNTSNSFSWYEPNSTHLVLVEPHTPGAYDWAETYRWYQGSSSKTWYDTVLGLYKNTVKGYIASSTATNASGYQSNQFRGCSNLEFIPEYEDELPSHITAVSSFCSYQYYGCRSLKVASKERFSQNITKVNPGFRHAQYAYCTALSVIWPEAFSNNVTYVDFNFRRYQYQYCSKLKAPAEEAMSNTLTRVDDYFRAYQYQSSGVKYAAPEVFPDSVTTVGTYFRNRQYSLTPCTVANGVKDGTYTIKDNYRGGQFNGNKVTTVVKLDSNDVAYPTNDSFYTSSMVTLKVPAGSVETFQQSENYPRSQFDDNNIVENV